MWISAGKLAFLTTLGIAFLVSGVVLRVIFRGLLKIVLTKNLVLNNGTDLFHIWAEPPITVHVKVYLFNVTNPEEVLSNTNKPILQEVGPYKFNQYRKKVELQFNDEEDTINYREQFRYEYVPEETNGSLNDIVTVLNFPFLAITSKGNEMDLLTKTMLPQFIRTFKSSLFVTKTVDELLFTGYEDKLLNYLQKISGETILPGGVFGLLREKNETIGPLLTVFTGKKMPRKFMKVFKFDNLTQLDCWNGEYCNKIIGSDGTINPPFMTPNDPVDAFVPELCRSAQLEYKKDVMVNSIKGYRYGISDEILGSPEIEPNNKCFCPTGKECYKSGVFNMGPCYRNAPIIFSYPHFLRADDSYYNAFIGLHRNEKLHTSYVDVEPTSGIAMKGYKRGQINGVVRPLSYIPVMKNVSEMIFPIFWVEEHGKWTDEITSMFWNRGILPQIILKIATSAFLVLSGISFCVVIVSVILRKKEKTFYMKVGTKPLEFKTVHI